MADDGGLDEAVRATQNARARQQEEIRRQDAADRAAREAAHQQIRDAVAAFMVRAGKAPHVIGVYTGEREEVSGNWLTGRSTRSVPTYKQRRAWCLRSHVPFPRDDDVTHASYASGQHAVYLTEDGEFVYGPETSWPGKPYFSNFEFFPPVGEILELLAGALA